MICRVCDGTELELALDLGMHPWCNHFLRPEEVGTEPRYPLRLVHCRRCGLAQLDHTVSKETMFGDHTYLSGVTVSLSRHFAQVAEEVDARFGRGTPHKAVLDIGSNDGTQLTHFQRLGWDVLGVEPSKTTAAIACERGVPTVQEFFNAETARRLERKFNVVNAAGVFFHLEELHSVTEGIRNALADDGVFVVQFLYMQSIVENLAFDQIYHEHLLYYNLATIERLLTRHGLSMFDAYLAPIHGGSIIGFATHLGRLAPSARLQSLRAVEYARNSNALATYQDFARRVASMRERNLDFLDSRKRAGKTIFGMGAPVKGNTLLNYFGVGRERIDCLVEKNPLRRGLFSPGSHIPIVMEHELERAPDVYYVLAWNFKDEILANHRDSLQRGVEFHFPVDPPGERRAA
jgi:SAM-dependent methyltransferase